jgi:hypothetical protein
MSATFESLSSEYGNNYPISSYYRGNKVAGELIEACQNLLSSNLKAGGKTFTFKGEHDFSASKNKLRTALWTDKSVVDIAAIISYLFQNSESTVEQLVYDVNENQFQNIIVLVALGTYDGNKNLYDRLTDFNQTSNKRPITISGGDRPEIILDFKRIEKRCEEFVKDFKINVQGKKIVGEEYEEEILLHGNQVMATETSPEGITYNVEKSGDLPSDASAREEIMASRIQDLEDLVESGTIVKYNIEKFSNKTVVKTYFRLLEDYQKEFNVQSIL